MIVWPATLPQYVEDSFEESPPDSRIFTPTDMGPPKVRKRFSAQVRPMTCTIMVDSDQLDTFDTFFTTTTGGGVLPFEFPDPKGSGTITVRFAQDTPRYGEFVSKYATISFKIEVLP